MVPNYIPQTTSGHCIWHIVTCLNLVRYSRNMAMSFQQSPENAFISCNLFLLVIVIVTQTTIPVKLQQMPPQNSKIESPGTSLIQNLCWFNPSGAERSRRLALRNCTGLESPWPTSQVSPEGLRTCGESQSIWG